MVVISKAISPKAKFLVSIFLLQQHSRSEYGQHLITGKPVQVLNEELQAVAEEAGLLKFLEASHLGRFILVILRTAVAGLKICSSATQSW